MDNKEHSQKRRRMVDNKGDVKAPPSWLNSPAFQESYQKAIEFYEKDEVLDARDRLELSKKYTSIARAQFIGGWAGFSAVFITPFAYRYYKTGAIRGVKVPRNFVFGLVAMVVSTQLSGSMMYKKKLQELDPTGELAAKYESKINKNKQRNQYGDFEADVPTLIDENQNQNPPSRYQKEFDMMNLLKNGSAPKWAMYFYTTYQNPRRRFPNPAEMMDELKKAQRQPLAPFLHQRDPFGLFKDQNEKNDEKNDAYPNPTKNAKPADNNQLPLEPPKPELSWNKVRQQNSGKATTAWDRIRNGEHLNDNNDGFDDDLDPFEESKSNVGPTINKPTKEEFKNLVEQERNGGSGLF